MKALFRVSSVRIAALLGASMLVLSACHNHHPYGGYYGHGYGHNYGHADRHARRHHRRHGRHGH